MKTEVLKYEVEIPSFEDFGNQYPHYQNYALTVGNNIFVKIMSPESFYKGMVSTIIGLPAVTGIAELISENIIPLKGTPNFNYTKQYIGALMCSLMEANGYSKTGIKKSIPHLLFTKGELYKKA